MIIGYIKIFADGKQCLISILIQKNAGPQYVFIPR